MTNNPFSYHDHNIAMSEDSCNNIISGFSDLQISRKEKVIAKMLSSRANSQRSYDPPDWIRSFVSWHFATAKNVIEWSQQRQYSVEICRTFHGRGDEENVSSLWHCPKSWQSLCGKLIFIYVFWINSNLWLWVYFISWKPTFQFFNMAGRNLAVDLLE